MVFLNSLNLLSTVLNCAYRFFQLMRNVRSPMIIFSDAPDARKSLALESDASRSGTSYLRSPGGGSVEFANSSKLNWQRGFDGSANGVGLVANSREEIGKKRRVVVKRPNDRLRSVQLIVTRLPVSFLAEHLSLRPAARIRGRGSINRDLSIRSNRENRANRPSERPRCSSEAAQRQGSNKTQPFSRVHPSRFLATRLRESALRPRSVRACEVGP